MRDERERGAARKRRSGGFLRVSFFNFRVRVENKRLVQKVTAITVVMFYKLFRPRPIVKTMFYITTEFIYTKTQMHG